MPSAYWTSGIGPSPTSLGGARAEEVDTPASALCHSERIRRLSKYFLENGRRCLDSARHNGVCRSTKSVSFIAAMGGRRHARSCKPFGTPRVRTLVIPSAAEESLNIFCGTGL